MTRAAFLSAASYRLGMFISVAGLAVTFVPVYFIAGALQPVVEASIGQESETYFGFLIIGMAATFLLTTAVSALAQSLSGAISTGTLEALLVTRAPLYQILIGMIGYGLSWNALRALLLIGGAAAVGVPVSWERAPLALAVVALMVTAYFALGLIAASMVLVFRTTGPLVTAIVTASSLLGGVYYSTGVIPSWLQDLSAVVPLTYALRALRMLLLRGASLGAVADDVLILCLFAAFLLAASAVVFAGALRYARSAGTLSQY